MQRKTKAEEEKLERIRQEKLKKEKEDLEKQTISLWEAAEKLKQVYLISTQLLK
jgi:predicted methyltransferase